MKESSRDRGKAELLDAAERLIATHGFDVPLREIAIAAGHRNNSAVQYHFGDRQTLLDAIVARRLVPMEAQRAAMVARLDAQGDANDIRGLVAVLALPIIAAPGTHYARFLEVVRPRLRTEPTDPGESTWPAVLDRLSRSIDAHSTGVRVRRVAAVATAMFALAADHERRVEAGRASPHEPDEIVDMLTGMITASTRSGQDGSPHDDARHTAS